MRKLITGVDADGRSCLLEASEIETAAPPGVNGVLGVKVARIFATDQSPPPARPAARGERIEVNLAPGLLRWNVVDHLPHAGPSVATTMHHKDTIDLVLVQEGNAELVLDDGRHPVGPGDCIVMPGNDHALEPGPDGCRVLAFVIGTPPREVRERVGE
jgi:hypothetical protein